MNTSQHTVTIPIADYNELIEAAKNNNAKFEKMRSDLVVALETVTYRGSRNLTPNELIQQVIGLVKIFK